MRTQGPEMQPANWLTNRTITPVGLLFNSQAPKPPAYADTPRLDPFARPPRQPSKSLLWVNRGVRLAGNYYRRAVLLQFHVQIEVIAGVGRRAGHKAFGAFLGLLPVDAHADPLQTPRDGQFVLELGHLGAKGSEVIKLFLQLSFLLLEAFELFEQEFPTAL